MKRLRKPAPVTSVELAAPDKPLMEPRLWGTWKSDRKKTFEHVVLPKATPEGLRKFRSLFGKPVVTWNKTTKTSYFDCERFLGFRNDRTPESEEYSVVARDSDRVVACLGRRIPNRKRKSGPIEVETLAELNKLWSLTTIEFDEDRGYRVSLGKFFEYFRRID